MWILVAVGSNYGLAQEAPLCCTTGREDVAVAGFERRTGGTALAAGPELSLGLSAPVTANLWLTGSFRVDWRF